MPSISPTLIHPDTAKDTLEHLVAGFDEPFDGVFSFLKAIYLTAHDRGMRVILDGGGGDVVLGEGSYLVRLLRQGHWKLAFAEIIAESRHWEEASPVPSLFRYAGAAFIPDIVKKPLRSFRHRRNIRGYLGASLISSELADRVGVEERFRRMRSIFPSSWTPDYAAAYCKTILPNMTAGRERYARIAAASGMEARDPFMDKRVIEFCSRLPGRLRFREGWPKMPLREIMAETLPNEVLWTRRKPHIGWLFSEEVTKLATNRGQLDIAILEEQLAGYVDMGALSAAWQGFCDGGDSEQIHYAHMLAIWLRKTATRPVVKD